MTDRRRRLQDILDRHDDAARAFHRTTTGLDAVQDDLEQIGRTLRDATHAIREAVDGMLAANRAALELWREEDDEVKP